MFRNTRVLFIAIFAFAAVPLRLSSQTAAAPPANASADEAAMARLVALRDSFINQIKAEGFQPSLAPPKIVLDNPPSFGRYEDDKNLLHIAAWSALSPEDQARFTRIAGIMTPGKTGEQEFEDGVHHWVFVHELGHWWQACQHKASDNHYSVEYGANRIAAAYWRLKDPALMENTAKRMTTISSVMTDPVPAGQAKEKFFNENYEQLAPTPAYRWFQYSMVLSVQAEKPLPSFKQTLQSPIYP
jgi:hypothetical protein